MNSTLRLYILHRQAYGWRRIWKWRILHCNTLIWVQGHCFRCLINVKEITLFVLTCKSLSQIHYIFNERNNLTNCRKLLIALNMSLSNPEMNLPGSSFAYLQYESTFNTWETTAVSPEIRYLLQSIYNFINKQSHVNAVAVCDKAGN